MNYAPQRVRTLEPKLPEVGRIRLGAEKTDPRRPGAPLDTFRFTSTRKDAIEVIAERYGGNVQLWKSQDGEQWQVTVTEKVIPVRLVPGALSQRLEEWDGRLRVTACDGEKAQVVHRGPDGAETETEPCHCDPPGMGACKLKTRLNLYVEGLNEMAVWRLETGSKVAAPLMLGQSDLVRSAGQEDSWVKAELSIESRTSNSVGVVSQKNRSGKTNYKVPVLRLTDERTTLKALMAADEARQIEAPEQAPQLPSGEPAQTEIETGLDALNDPRIIKEPAKSPPAEAETTDDVGPVVDFTARNGTVRKGTPIAELTDLAVVDRLLGHYNKKGDEVRVGALLERGAQLTEKENADKADAKAEPDGQAQLDIDNAAPDQTWERGK